MSGGGVIEISGTVRAALESGGAVVALESTVLTHGLPRPRNLDVARALEATVRESGAVPATVAVLGGVPAVGLADEELERIASADPVRKLSTRDLAAALAAGADGGTTVAGTMWIAAAAGVQVFATGGIGGVHRGSPRDVSADIAELARTPMLVVCAGAKSVLDLPETREALESAGVLVLGWRTDVMPAFFSSDSGLPVDERVETAEEVAAIWHAHRGLAAPGAVLLCVPPPVDPGLPAGEMDAAVAAALADAARSGIRGKDVTPFLLEAVAGATGGRSLEANIRLLRANAAVAATVACATAER